MLHNTLFNCHPFPSIYLGQITVAAGSQDALLPSHVLQLLLGDPNAFPGQVGYIIPPACCGSALALEPVGLAPPQECNQEASRSDGRNTLTDPFRRRSKQAAALFQAHSGCTRYSPSLRMRSDTLQRQILAVCTGSTISVFWSLPRACDLRGGWECSQKLHH